MEKRARVHETNTVFSGKIFDLVMEKVTLPNGSTTDFIRIRHPGAAAIVAVTDDDRVVLLRQYRHAVEQTLWEIPAGTRDAKEPEEQCARRELEEETGFSAGKMTLLGRITPVPGYCDEQVTLFLATALSPTFQNLDADEVLEVERIPFQEALEMAMDGRLQDAKSIIGLLWAARHMRRVMLPSIETHLP